MSSYSVTDARKKFADLIGQVQFGGERFTIEKHGKPVAALVSAEDYEILEELEDRALLKMALEALEEYEKNPVTYTHEEVFGDLHED